jgi:FkbM family methyltransferase
VSAGAALIDRLSARLEWARFHRALGVEPRAHLERIGNEYGGYVVPADLPRPEWICYSCGVGEDVSFDLALIERFGCSVFAFDPTPRAVDYAAPIAAENQRFHFAAFGVAGRDEERRFFAPLDATHVSHTFTGLAHGDGSFVADCRRLESLMALFGHERIDLLKLDIEGAEYEVLEALGEGHLRPAVICLEYHVVTSHRALVECARSLQALGYRAVHHRRLVVTFLASEAV